MSGSGMIGQTALLSRSQKFTRVLAAITKRCLAEEMPLQRRLEFLEHLEKMTQPAPQERQGCVSKEEIAAIQPMDDRAMQIINEILKLDPLEALDVYADNFETFAKLNPSLAGPGAMS